jgi:adenine deaminase
MKKLSLLSIEGTDFIKQVIDVTLGREKADLSIIHATLLNVYTGELLPDYSISVKGDWIAYIGQDPEGTIGKNTNIIDARGKYVIPGLIDGHTHIADCFYNPSEFLRFAMIGGTTTVVTETIEPFPILGCKGLVEFLASLKEQPIKIFATVPAMVSTSKAVRALSNKELKRLLKRDDILGLGESYWQAILQEPEGFLPDFMETLQSGKRLEGHSAGAKGKKLLAYTAHGITSCHEPVNPEEVLERLRLGLYVMVREGSIRKDLASISRIRDRDVDLRRLILVSDGISPTEIVEKGYMENIVRKAIECGFEPAKAIQMATLNVAEYFQLDGITGGIVPGKHADMLIISDIRTIKPEYVISRGKVIAQEGRLLSLPRRHRFSSRARNSVFLTEELNPSNFAIQIRERVSDVRIRVIDQVTDLVTKEYIASVPVTGGRIGSDVTRDLLKVAAIDRANAPGRMFVGLIRGFRLTGGAIASSSAWDTSDIIVIGANDEDMALAVNRIHSMQGGAVLSYQGKILEEIPLPIFGLMSDLPMEDLTRKLMDVRNAIKTLGAPFADPLRTLITLTGAAIPFIRICEEGLVDIKTGKKRNLICD